MWDSFTNIFLCCGRSFVVEDMGVIAETIAARDSGSLRWCGVEGHEFQPR